MRLRNIPGAEEAVAKSSFCIQNPKEHRGHFNEIFANQNPIHIEIGMGKGQFLCALAHRNTNVNYIGIERYPSVMIKALAKLEKEPADNLRLICMDARDLSDIFSPKEISRIYLNFSDPWPKDRHAKRRLTSPVFLDIYKDILSSNNEIHFKTDNLGLFEYSVETFDKSPYFTLYEQTYDLHADNKMCVGNIMTEYEEKFSAQGNNICKLIAKRK